jgi:hypothetical protein
MTTNTNTPSPSFDPSQPALFASDRLNPPRKRPVVSVEYYRLRAVMCDLFMFPLNLDQHIVSQVHRLVLFKWADPEVNERVSRDQLSEGGSAC